MGTVLQGSPVTVRLAPGRVLSVTADSKSSGQVFPFAERVGDTAGLTSVAASTTQTFGPYADPKSYQIDVISGSLSYSDAAVDFPTAAEADADSLPRNARKNAVVAGGAAGDHTLAAIAVGDVLVSVIRLVGAGVAITDVADITSEFTVAAGKINNTGGTNTTGDKLLVAYNDLT